MSEAEVSIAPIKSGKETVGTIVFSDDGSFKGRFDSEETLKEILEFLKYGYSDGIRIEPNCIPAKEMKATHEQERVREQQG